LTGALAVPIFAPMRVGRTILALLIAFSVAALPAARLSAAIPEPDLVVSAPQSECCEHAAMPCHAPHQKTDDCMSTSGCIACFNFVGPVLSDVVFSPKAHKIAVLRESRDTASQTASPPFRPPRA
jgi:hypothetical protein